MRNKKKRLSIVLAGLMMIFGCSGCKSRLSSGSSISVNPSTEVHVHKFDQKVISDKFLAIEATCDFPASYHYSCRCGKKGNKVFEHEECLGHFFSNWSYVYRTNEDGKDIRQRRCKRCGKIETQYLYYLNNLKFTITDEENRYAQVVGYREFFKGDLDREIRIPGQWNGCKVVSIADNSFINNPNIISVSIPSSVTYIGKNAFEGCKNLTKMILSEDSKLTVIDDHAFKYCSIINELKCPSSLKSIGKQAFMCNSLRGLTLNEGLEEIYDDAFFGNYIPGDIVIPKSVKKIYANAFNTNCFTSCTFNGNVESMWRGIFGYNHELTTVRFAEGFTDVATDMFKYCGKLNSVVLPSTIERIKPAAFMCCTALKSIQLPSSLKRIKDSAFYDSGITSINIPSSVESIHIRSFCNCKELKSITVDDGNNRYYSKDNCLIEKDTKKLSLACDNSVIPTDGSVTTIGTYFYSINSTSIVIPLSVKKIETRAFYYCTDLNDVYYSGSEEQFNEIEIGDDNDNFLKANFHYNYTV